MSHKLSPVQLAKLKETVEEHDTGQTFDEDCKSSHNRKPVWKYCSREPLKPKKRYDCMTYMDDLVEGSDYNPLEYLNR